MRTKRAWMLAVVAPALLVASLPHGYARATEAARLAGTRPSHVGLGAECFVRLRLFDRVSLSHLRMQDSWLGDTCTSPIEGVTVTPRTGLFDHQYDIEGFPVGFTGPADLLDCQVLYFEDECQAGSLEQFYQDVGVVSAMDGDGVPISNITLCPVRAVCSEYCPSSEPGPYIAGACGDADGSESIVAADALVVLKAATGGTGCALHRCDTDNDSVITATDALRILSTAVGLLVELRCPPPCEARPVPGE